MYIYIYIYQRVAFHSRDKHSDTLGKHKDTERYSCVETSVKADFEAL